MSFLFKAINYKTSLFIGRGDIIANDIIYMNIDKGDKIIVTPSNNVKIKITGKVSKTIEGVESNMKKIWTEDQLVEINEMKHAIERNAQAIERNAQGIKENREAIEKNAQAIERNAQGIRSNGIKIKELDTKVDKLLNHFNIS